MITPPGAHGARDGQGGRLDHDHLLHRRDRIHPGHHLAALTLALALTLTLTLTRCIRELLSAAPPAGKTAPPLTDESTEDAGSDDATEDALAAVDNSIASGVSVEGAP